MCALKMEAVAKQYGSNQYWEAYRMSDPGNEILLAIYIGWISLKVEFASMNNKMLCEKFLTCMWSFERVLFL